jgi:hypothetical protein
LDYGGFNHDIDEERILIRWSRRNRSEKEKRYGQADKRRGGNGDALYTSGITLDSTDKIPEELAIEQTKVARPNGVCVG